MVSGISPLLQAIDFADACPLALSTAIRGGLKSDQYFQVCSFGGRTGLPEDSVVEDQGVLDVFASNSKSFSRQPTDIQGFPLVASDRGRRPHSFWWRMLSLQWACLNLMADIT